MKLLKVYSRIQHGTDRVLLVDCRILDRKADRGIRADDEACQIVKSQRLTAWLTESLREVRRLIHEESEYIRLSQIVGDKASA